MISTRSRRWTLSLLALAFVTATGLAGEEPANRPRSLFDGKTLAGWKKTESFKSGDVKVSEGSIVIEPGGPMSGITSTLTDLPTTHYELRYEARRLSGEDFFAASTFPVGKSFVTLVNGGWGGSVTGLSCLNGADASENESRRFVKYQNDTWYRFRIQVTDSVIRVWVDDVDLFTVTHRDLTLKTRLETRGNQPLGFATYKSRGAIRSVELRPLTAAEIEANNKLADRD